MSMSESATTEATKSICSMCEVSLSLYTCPRCNASYCSIDCYRGQKHLKCSEEFYKESVMSEMSEKKISRCERAEVMEMLARLNDAHPIEPEVDMRDLQERIDGLNLDKDSVIIWERMTSEERREFEEMVMNGRLDIPVWEPWWCEKLVSDAGQSTMRPPIAENILRLHRLIKGEPSPFMVYSLLIVIWSYAYLCRLSNGEVDDETLQFAQDIHAICPTFEKKIFSSFSEGLSACMENLRLQDVSLSRPVEFSIGIIYDLQKIVSKPHYVLSVLSHLRQLFEKAGLSVLSGKGKHKKTIRKQLFHDLRRLEFLLAWYYENQEFVLSTLPEIDRQICIFTTDLQRKKQPQNSKCLKKVNKVKLIEEL